jgi:hypothetical protein
VEHCDRILKKDQFQDYDGAANGLQAENKGHVSRIAAAWTRVSGRSTWP